MQTSLSRSQKRNQRRTRVRAEKRDKQVENETGETTSFATSLNPWEVGAHLDAKHNVKGEFLSILETLVKSTVVLGRLQELQRHYAICDGDIWEEATHVDDPPGVPEKIGKAMGKPSKRSCYMRMQGMCATVTPVAQQVTGDGKMREGNVLLYSDLQTSEHYSFAVFEDDCKQLYCYAGLFYAVEG